MPKSSTAPLLALSRYVKPHRTVLLGSTLLRVANLGLGVFILGLAGFFVSRAVIEGAMPVPREWIVFVAVGLVKAVARYTEQVSGHVAAFHILDTLRGELFDGFSRSDKATRAGERSGDLASRAMGDVELVEVYYAHTIAPVISALLFVSAVATFAGLFFGPGAAFALFAILGSAGIVIPALFQRLGAAAAAKARRGAGLLSADLSESLAGIQDLVASNALDRRAEALRQSGRAVARHGTGLAAQGALKDALVDALLVSSLLVVAFLGLASGRVIDPSLVWAFIAGLAGGFGAILAVSRAVDDLPKSAAAAERILSIIDTPEPLFSSSEAPTPRDSKLVVDSVEYLYGAGKGISDLSFTLDEGEHIFIAGPSGSGKSTIAALLLGLMAPQKGGMSIGGISYGDYDEEGFRRLVSAAIQEPGMLRGTVEENLRVGLPFEDGEFDDAVFQVPALHELFGDLPDGKETLLGGADEQVSGGQKRRIALARLLARGPRILILDEAFSGLDYELRTKLRSNLLDWARASRRSVIEFSHELRDAARSDSVMVLDRGRVAEGGTYAELAEGRGLFASLLLAQNDAV